MKENYPKANRLMLSLWLIPYNFFGGSTVCLFVFIFWSPLCELFHMLNSYFHLIWWPGWQDSAHRVSDLRQPINMVKEQQPWDKYVLHFPCKRFYFQKNVSFQYSHSECLFCLFCKSVNHIYMRLQHCLKSGWRRFLMLGKLWSYWKAGTGYTFFTWTVFHVN